MSFFHNLISEELVYALGWTVLHSLWQAAVIMILLGVINLRLQRQSARIRYFAGILSLLFVLLMGIITFVSLYQPGMVNEQTEVFLLSGDAPVLYPVGEGQGTFQSLLDQGISYFDRHLPLIVSLWLLGAALFAMRLLGGLAYLEHLKFNGIHPVSASWKRRFRELSEKMEIRLPVELLESARIHSPIVVGHIKPIVLMPIGALNSLSTEEVEAILAHELAHIARHDYLFNLLQSVVEVLFYFNPAVWWISAYIRREREHCCDDLAVSFCGDALIYARALVSLQELCRSSPHLAMTLARDRDQLLNRVYRLLDQPVKKNTITARLLATAALVITIFCFSMTTSGSEKDKIKMIRLLPLIETAPVISLSPSEVASLPHLIQMTADTLPQDPTSLEVVKGDGERMKVKIDKGKITSLEIDGKVIPESEFHQYEKMVENYLGRSTLPVLPVPPAPPAPPAPPSIRIGELPPMPPAPPMPPLPPMPGLDQSDIRSIESKEDEDGHTVLIIKMKDGSRFEFNTGEKYDPEDLVFADNLEQLINGSFDFSGLEDLHIDFGDWAEEYAAVMENMVDPSVYLDQWSGIKDSMAFHFDHDFNFEMPDMDQWQEQMEEWEDQWNEQIVEWEKLGNSGNFYFDGDNRFLFSGGYGFINEELRDRLETEMLRDGLINSRNAYDLELSRNALTVNGKKQPRALAEKYWDLFEENSDGELSEKATLRIKKNGKE